MKSAIIDGLKRWKDYSGRSSRAQFWWFNALFLISPIISVLLSLTSSFALWSMDKRSLGQISIFFSFAYLILIPPMIAVSIRRMHDVGKSGWFNLVPIYSLYLHVQPSKELGRIPGWIFAEKAALVFLGATLIGFFIDGLSALGGTFVWSAIYLGLRAYNNKKKD